MSEQRNPYQKYKATAVQSASRERLLLMMYEGAIRFVKQAMIAIDQKKIAEKGQNIGRAYDIVIELMNTLDHKIGGEIAANLERLYIYITDELTKANITGKKEHLENSLKVLETLYSGWQEAIEKLKSEQKKEA